MPRYMGAWTNTSSTGARYRAGMDYTVSGATVSVQNYLFESEYSIDKGITLTRTGSLTGSYSVSVDIGGSGGIVAVGRGGSVTGVRGGTVTIGGRFTNVLHGLEPSFALAIPIPALAPNTPGKPTISAIRTTGFTAKTVAPANNGAAITTYEWQWTPTVGSGTAQSAGTQLGPTTGFTSNTTYQVRVRALNSVGWSGWSAWSNAFTTLPAAPAAPGAPTVTRTSDTQHSLAWTRNATTPAPYASQQVQRAAWTSGAYGPFTTIATVAGTATTYTDTTGSANQIYRYRVVAVNAAAQTPGSQSGVVFTTPAAPTNVQAAKSANSDIVVTWTPNHRDSSNNVHQLQHSGDGGATWDTVIQIAQGVSTYTHTTPSTATPHLYRVRSFISGTGFPGAGLASAYVNSNTVQLAAPPSAPTLTAPTGSRDATTAITMAWKHNPVDSSAQRQYEMRYRNVGSSAWISTGTVVSGTQNQVIAANTWSNGAQTEWQVRTWGVHATASPWSATGVFSLSSPPIVTLLQPDPGTPWQDPHVTVGWAYYDAEGSAQSQWQVELLDVDGAVKETKSAADAVTSTVLAALLPDATEWTARVRVRDGAGMWSEWAEATFTVDYPEPPAPILGAVWDPARGLVEITLENPDGTPEVVSNDVYRSINGGPWELIATQLPVGGAFNDYEAASVGTNSYRAVAYSALPSASESEIYQLVIERNAMSSGYLSGGPGFGTVGRATYDLKVQPTGGRSRVQHDFAGRQDPVEFSGSSRTRQLAISFVVLPAQDDPDASLIDMWEATLPDLRGPHLWRDPEGRHMYGTISDIAAQPIGYDAYSVSFTMTRTGRR